MTHNTQWMSKKKLYDLNFSMVNGANEHRTELYIIFPYSCVFFVVVKNKRRHNMFLNLSQALNTNSLHTGQ